MVPHPENSKRPSDQANQTQRMDAQCVKRKSKRTFNSGLALHVATTQPRDSATKAAARKTEREEPSRRMVSATLFGQHTFHAENGQKVHIFHRGGKYLARARVLGQQVGVTLGTTEADAHLTLCRLLSQFARGSFVSPTEARRSILGRRPVPQLTSRELCDEFLKEKQKINGAALVQTYLARLRHVLDFAERPKNLRRWGLARDIDREFAVELRAFLMSCDITPNGRSGSSSRKMSAKMVRLCLEAVRSVLNWGSKPQVRKLPADYCHPFTEDVLGHLPSKDPLRQSPITMDKRMRMVSVMDQWQLLHLTPLLILPTRFEDVAGAVISDFDFQAGVWRLGTRFGGNDFNKGRVNVVMPLPPVLRDLLWITADGRAEGPMFLCPRVFKKPLRYHFPQLRSQAELDVLIQERLASAPQAEVATEHDRKDYIRKLIHDLGAVSTDDVSRQLQRLFAAVGLRALRAYDIRHATTEEMNRSGLSHLAWRYFTLHKTNDILNTYSGVNVFDEMARYYNHIAPLLQAIERRARELGIPIDQARENAA